MLHPWQSLTRTAAPGAEPVSTTEIKAQLRIDVADEDTLLGAYVTAAREWVEEQTRRSLITQTWKALYNLPPSADRLALPRGPVQSITSVKSYDTLNAASTVTTTDYFLIGDELVLDYGILWPDDLRSTGGLEVIFVTGYGDASTDVPTALRQAIKLLAGHWFENREATGASLVEAPLGVAALILPYRQLRL